MLEIRQNRIPEFIDSLKKSSRMGHQVVFHEKIPARDAEYGSFPSWSGEIRRLLERQGISSLYSHQLDAIEKIRSRRHVIVSTPTASGKTLVYNLPVIEKILTDPESRALYLFPLKALAQDQMKAFMSLTAALDGASAPTVAIYDGDTSAYRRRRIRELPPNVLMTNPEMLHLSLLPHHHLWSRFWSGLTHVVVDEVHTCRGIMGSNMAWVFRRTRRMCDYYGVDPTFVFCSATVGNPVELASLLTGLRVEAVTQSGAPQGMRHVLFVNPEEGAAVSAITMLHAAMARGLRTIVYTQSRKLTELIGIWVAQRVGPLGDRVSVYRAGFLPEERREIECKLASGELLAVVSTSALELGIDIGSLDLCILVGYPGTVMATWQRGGRVGRSFQDSALVLIAGQDALDQYFMRNPRDLIKAPPEAAVLNPENPVVMERHLTCAAAEIPIRAGEAWVAHEAASRLIADLETRGHLLRSAEGDELYAAWKNPHRKIDLRGAGRSFQIFSGADGRSVGLIDGFRVQREAHPGAVYLHRGETYVVDDLSFETRTVTVTPRKVDYFTRVRGRKNTEILDVMEEKVAGATRIRLGRLRVTDQVTGYERRHVRGQRLLNVVSLDLPPQVFETEGIWIEVPRHVQQHVERRYLHFMGGIHALEHAAIGILPLLVLTDRNDLGGISTPFHPQVGRAAVFVYDGIPGGVGLSREAFRRAEKLLHQTLRAIETCPCESGCPSCVHSPKCGSGNRPIDKTAALFILKALVKAKGKVKVQAETIRNKPRAGNDKQRTRNRERIRFGVFDIETQRSAGEVGGWHRADLMGISCAVLHDSEKNAFFEFREPEVLRLVECLKGFDLVVGFNVKRFDYKVLRAYSDFDFRTLPTLDILEVIHRRLGYRLSLDHLACATLGKSKTADGLQALKWWKEGRIDEIVAYCRQDVAITRDLFLFGKKNGYLLFRNKAGKTVRVPVEW